MGQRAAAGIPLGGQDRAGAVPGRGEDLPPPTVAARIDGACDRFEAAWQAGLRPRIEEALAAEPRDWHPELLRCLLAVELAYRARRGEHLASADYRARFPGAAEVIRAAFEALPAVAPGAAGPRATGLGSPDPGRGSPGAIHEPGRPSVATDRRTASDPEAALGCSPRSTGLRFRVLRPHARGGLGEVFVAHDEELNREVALKEILGRFADDPVQRARFLREAEIAGRLEHPGIVPVHGLGRYRDGRPYYAMRLVKGHTFQEAIDHFHGARAPGRDPGKRSLTLRQLLGRFIAVCNAIAYAHSQGIVHRDLKPDNILLGPFGETLVVDWGLAKPIGPPHDGPGVTAEVFRATPVGGSLPTQTGSVVGTPAYMSPEQAAGRLDLVGPASDVYSLGATLYCLLTGRAPVEDPDLDVVLRKVRRGEFRSPRQVNPASDPALEAICSKAMARGPSDRYASPRDLADDLEHWLADEPVSAWREPPWTRSLRWAQRHRTALAGLTAALAVAGLSVGIERLRNDGRPVSPQVEVREVVFPGQADASSREDPTAPVLLPTVLTQIGFESALAYLEAHVEPLPTATNRRLAGPEARRRALAPRPALLNRRGDARFHATVLAELGPPEHREAAARARRRALTLLGIDVDPDTAIVLETPVLGDRRRDQVATGRYTLLVIRAEAEATPSPDRDPARPAVHRALRIPDRAICLGPPTRADHLPARASATDASGAINP